MIYYIADMHFGHTNVIRFDNRPFADTEQMDEVLIQNWNERVTADDTVYVLGDAFWKNEENSIRQPFYALLGASATLAGEHYALELWGKNITATRYHTFYFVSIGHTFLQRGHGATMGATLRLNF